jgi:hypothetical protein
MGEIMMGNFMYRFVVLVCRPCGMRKRVVVEAFDIFNAARNARLLVARQTGCAIDSLSATEVNLMLTP